MSKYWLRCGLAALCLWCTLAIFNSAAASTYYVRTDGGTSTQCTGLANAAYPGTGSGQACAFSHPYYALQPGWVANGSFKGKSVLKPGDTLMIGSGSYMMGYGAPNSTSTACASPGTWQCAITGIPSGLSASQPTVVSGDCSKPPQLWGTQRNNAIFWIANVHDVKIACLELTDHSTCIEYYQPVAAQACQRSTYPYGDWAVTAIQAQDVTNLTLANLNIHGFADYGVIAGRLSGTTTVSNVTVRANGWGGWNGDLGGNDDSSSNSGTLKFDQFVSAWNGCAEAYPATTLINCWGQNQGGYGDGFSEAWTGGNWVFTRSSFLHNTQDGLDLLYANGSGSVLMDQLTASFNAGNQIKTSGPATLQNSVVNGYCNDWQPPMPIAGDGSSGVAGSMCRADGTAVVMQVTGPGQTTTVAYSTITGNGDTLFVGGGNTVGCGHTDGCTPYVPNSSDVNVFSNNIWLGQTSVIPRDDGRDTALDWYTDGTYYGVVKYQNNLIWNVKNSFCPSGNICKDPKLANETLAAFDATLLAGSPAIGAAKGGAVLAYDYDDNARKNPTSIGALEYGSSGSAPPPPPIVPPRAPGRPHCKWRFCNHVMNGAGEPAYPATGGYRAPAPYTAPAQRYTPRTPYSTVVDYSKL